MPLQDIITVLELLKKLNDLRIQLKLNKKELGYVIDETQKFKDILQKYADDESLMTGNVIAAVESFNKLVHEINAYVAKYSEVTVYNGAENYFYSKSKAKEIADLLGKLDRHMSFFSNVQGLDSECHRLDDVSLIGISIAEIIAEVKTYKVYKCIFKKIK